MCTEWIFYNTHLAGFRDKIDATTLMLCAAHCFNNVAQNGHGANRNVFLRMCGDH